MRVYTYNTPVIQLSENKKNEVIILHFFFAPEESHKNRAVSFSDVEQGIRQLQSTIDRSDEKTLEIEKFSFLSLCYKSRKNAFKMKTETSAYLMTKGTCGFVWFIEAI